MEMIAKHKHEKGFDVKFNLMFNKLTWVLGIHVVPISIEFWVLR